MSVIVRDNGFNADGWSQNAADRVIVPIADISDTGMPADNRHYGLDVPSDTDPETMIRLFDHVELVRIAFPSFADGRGFSIAKRIREMGYLGIVRAHGHLLADQYALARRSGFDEVEISDELAARQPENQWLEQTDPARITYQNRLGV